MTDRRSLSLGVILVAVGIFFLLRHAAGFSGPGPTLVLIGALLLTLSGMRGFRGPLLPAGVLLGLGAAFLVQEPLARWMPRWSTLVLGIGVGFLLVAALDASAGRGRSPAPMIPGVILVAVAAAAALSRTIDLSGLVVAVSRLWPWLLVAAGATLVATSWKRRRV